VSVTVVLDLAPHRNSVGSTLPGVTESFGLDWHGRTLPAEELVALAPLMGAPIAGWGRGGPDNVECDGQTVSLPYPLSLDSWSVIGACFGGSMYDTFSVVDAGGRRTPVRVGLTDLYGQRAEFGNVAHLAMTHLHVDGADVRLVRPRLWRARHRFAAPVDCRQIVLPINPGMHVFAFVLEGRPC
jgi:hypothetical protein